MTYDTRQTINVSQDKMTFVCPDFSITGKGYPTGTAKTIWSERDGSFRPEEGWRYNPVRIVTGKSSAPFENYSIPRWNGTFNMVGNIVSYCVRPSMNYTWWYENPAVEVPGWMINMARVKAQNKRLENAWAGGVFLAELKESLELIVSPVKGARRILRKGLSRSKKYKNRKRRSKYLNDYWLEARYGWIPLASDISDIHERITLGIQRHQKSFFVTRGGIEEVVSSTSSSYSILKYLNRFELDLTKTDECTALVVSTCGWNYNVGHEADETWSLLGLHKHDIPGVIWEKVPFSFALDWWFNVGSFISYLRPTPWLSKIGEGYSVKRSFKREYKVNEFRIRFGRVYEPVQLPSETLTICQDHYQRFIPTGAVTAPVFDPRFNSVKHLVDAAAILFNLKR